MTAPAPPPPARPSSRHQFAILIAAIAVIMNGMFYVLSMVYFDGKRKTASMLTDPDLFTDAIVNDTRFAFLIYTAVVAGAAIAAVYWTRWVTHGLAALAGLAALVTAYFAFQKGMVLTLPVSLFVIGVLFPLLTWRSLEKSRGAWAFLVAMCFTMWLLFSFAAPKVKAQLEISLWTAYIIPGLFAVAWIGLAMLRHEYRERAY